MEKLDQRKEKILSTIIKEHIKTGSPVGSSVLVEKYKLDISPATVRNEMAALEDGGFIAQPHTSAGRIPTEKAFKYYLQDIDYRNKFRRKKENDIVGREIEKILTDNNEENFRNVAKYMAQVSGNAIFWAFHRHNVYYTGLSQLFQQPEFRELDLICDISAIIDRIDEIANNVFDDIGLGLHTLIGEENPFGNFCGTILAKYKIKEQPGLFGLLGPIRMNYEKNLELANLILNKIKDNK